MRAARVDKSQKEIVDLLRRLGCSVEPIRSLKEGLPDLLVGFRGFNYLVECKTPKTGYLSDGQKEWAKEWRGSKPYVLRNTDDVLSFIRTVGEHR